MAYILADIEAKKLETWRGDDFALLNYPPRRYEQWNGVNDTTRLVLNFKENVPEAVKFVSDLSVAAMARQAAKFRDELDCGYVIAVPRSGAGVQNYGCEAVAKALASRYPYLRHMPGALERTAGITPSHMGGAHTVAEHAASISYRGGALGPDLRSLRCRECAKNFRTEIGFAWHLEHIHGAAARTKSIIIVDDVTTHGSTGEACRQVLTAATGAPRVVGFFIGKTGGW